MDLKKLAEKIPCKWRVQSFSKNKPIAICIPYLDAKAVMDTLDRLCGPENWQSDYRTIDGNLFAGIGIKTVGIGDAHYEWVWKWDVGTASKEDPVKGMVSDAFKRAGAKWGIGRFLRDMPVEYVDADKKKADNVWPMCIDAQKKRIFDLTEFINNRAKPKGKKKPEPEIDKTTGEIKQTPDEEFAVFIQDTKISLRELVGDDSLYESTMAPFKVKMLKDVAGNKAKQKKITNALQKSLDEAIEANKK